MAKAFLNDRQAVQRELGRLKRVQLDAAARAERLQVLEKRLRASSRRRLRREQRRPQLTYPPELPIVAKKDEIVAAIRRHRVVIVAGETGSGKTTQIPKFCLAAGRGIHGRIGCTQPRRIAATSVAHRIAEELGETLGQSVGYKIRFKDRTAKDAYIKLMTDGILLAEAQSDPLLTAYDTIIVDEAHERSLNIDFILGILKTLLRRRKDLKLIITSATIDTQKFSQAFGRAPVIEVSGRMYPVTVRYLTIDNDSPDNGDQTHIDLALRGLALVRRESIDGDVLVFMPTEQDIRDTCEAIEACKIPRETILPLFGRLSGAEQARVFKPLSGRKIIVATNVAETSLTIPGIRYVIDSGLARISRYLPRSRSTALPVVPVSKSSADQRKGRCGRVAHGVCIRLYPEEDYLGRELYTAPEILRANLADVILRMIALNLGDIDAFPFIDRPDPKSIRDGYDLLVELGAIRRLPATTGGGRRRAPAGRYGLTRRGRVMARIPIDPRLSRMLIEARKEQCLAAMTVIVSVLSVADPRERPLEKAAEADAAHLRFRDPQSDFVTLLNIWQAFQAAVKTASSKSQVRKFCRAHFLSYPRMREWRDIHLQVRTVLEEHFAGVTGLNAKQADVGPEPSANAAKTRPTDNNSTGADFAPAYQALHRSILSGFLSNIAVQREKNIFIATRQREVMIFPGSGLFNRAGGWIVAAEMVETSRLFARTCARIDTRWLEALGKDLCRYTHLNPRWERKRGEVVADEQVSLFGLTIVTGRTVSYGSIDAVDATRIFVHSALVAEDVRRPPAFLAYNRRMIEGVRDMENRIRRRDILVSEEELAEFYAQRLADIYDLRSLERRIRQKGGDGFLRLTEKDLQRYRPDPRELARFPRSLELGRERFDCRYSFEPGQGDDGLTIQIPSALAPMVPPGAVDWLVPGLLGAKIEALIKGLPKAFRKRLVPVTATVEVIMAEMERGQAPLLTCLSRFIHGRFGVDIPAEAWPQGDLPEHLRARLAITGPRGEEICASRDARVLERQISCRLDSADLDRLRRQWERDHILDWDFPDLPVAVTTGGGGAGSWALYPGLEISAAAGAEPRIHLRLFQERDKALAAHIRGVAALFGLHFAQELKYLRRQLRLPAAMAAAAKNFGGLTRVQERFYDSHVQRLLGLDIRTRQAFQDHARQVAARILPEGQQLLAKGLPVIDTYQRSFADLDRMARDHRARAAARLLADLQAELRRLVPENFMLLYEPERLVHLPRYMQALSLRAQRALVDMEKDRAKAAAVAVFSRRLQQLLQDLSAAASAERRQAVETLFWMIEEYKVSLFAQELKTAVPISPKRLERQLADIMRMV